MSDEFTFEDAMNLNPRAKRKPELQLSGKDGNAFFILYRAMQTLEKAGYSKEDVKAYEAEATSGDYDNLLAVTMRWFDVL
jgi:hypothetical protein